MATVIDLDNLPLEESSTEADTFERANTRRVVPVVPGKLSCAPLAQKDRIHASDPDLHFRARSLDPHQAQRSSSIFSEGIVQQAVTLRFEDLMFDVKLQLSKKRKRALGPDASVIKPVLKGISGEVKPGNVLAIMGSSGAGKTTLLNLLAGRLSATGKGVAKGRILVNGHKRDFATFSKMSAYVLQDDIFFADLTVRETILFSARLRLPSEMTTAEREERVDRVITELGLSKVCDTMIGSDLVRGVSGGERKRVNIGTELITNPSLVFLDEPTSGLDAFNAQNVMSSLLQLAKGGRTVICTIHQPRSEIYSLLDQLLLLSEGYCMYMGSAQAAVPYFKALDFPCPKQHNPADFFLDLISLDTRTQDQERATRKRIQYLAEAFEDHRALHPLQPPQKGEILAFAGSQRRYNTTWVQEFCLLSSRAFKVMMRERATNIARLIQVIFFSIILSMIWLQESGDSATDVAPTAGILFFLLINQGFTGLFQIIFSFPDERSIVNKERASRSYRVTAYFLSKSFVELPRTLLANTIFLSILYPAVDMRPGAEHFFLFVVVVLLVTLTAESGAYLVSAGAKNSQQAGALAPLFMITSLLFGGFFIQVNAIPVWLSWLRYLSFIKYGFAAVLQVQYRDRMLDTSGCSVNAAFCPTDGNAVIRFYDADDFSYGMNLVMLGVLIVFFRGIAYWILRRNGPRFDTTL